MIHVLNFREPIPENHVVINTTSRSTNWSKGLSPFFLGPVEFGGLKAQNVENFYQYHKTYACHVDANQNPTPEYFAWRDAGLKKTWADRYPMGKGAKPLYSWFNNQKLSYIEARKQIYMPLYQQAVQVSTAWEELQKVYQTSQNVVLLDFDAYDHRKINYSWEDVINCSSRKMGHAFVLAMMLEKYL